MPKGDSLHTLAEGFAKGPGGSVTIATLANDRETNLVGQMVAAAFQMAMQINPGVKWTVFRDTWITDEIIFPRVTVSVNCGIVAIQANRLNVMRSGE